MILGELVTAVLQLCSWQYTDLRSSTYCTEFFLFRGILFIFIFWGEGILAHLQPEKLTINNIVYKTNMDLTG